MNPNEKEIKWNSLVLGCWLLKNTEQTNTEIGIYASRWQPENEIFFVSVDC